MYRYLTFDILIIFSSTNYVGLLLWLFWSICIHNCRSDCHCRNLRDSCRQLFVTLEPLYSLEIDCSLCLSKDEFRLKSPCSKLPECPVLRTVFCTACFWWFLENVSDIKRKTVWTNRLGYAEHFEYLSLL